MFSVSAPGKIHLTSAHIVVHGKPALLSAIDLRTKTTVRPNNNEGKIEIISDMVQEKVSLTAEEILLQFAEAQKTWQEFSKSKNPLLLKQITAQPLSLSICAVAQALFFLKKRPENLLIKINSTIPPGTNMGSSAALSASITGALFLYFGQKLDKEKINELVYQTEKLVHGFPSGGDNTVIVFGGLMWYRKETEFIKLFKTLEFAPNNNFLIIDSGKPTETTGELVLKVNKLLNKRPKYTQKIFNAMEGFKKDFIVAYKEKNISEIKRIMISDERLLEKLGVVSPETKLLIRDLEKLNAAIGVSGAGGFNKGSGVLVVFTDDKNSIINYTNNLKLQHYDISLGVEGLRKDEDER